MWEWRTCSRPGTVDSASDPGTKCDADVAEFGDVPVGGSNDDPYPRCEVVPDAIAADDGTRRGVGEAPGDVCSIVAALPPPPRLGGASVPAVVARRPPESWRVLPARDEGDGASVPRCGWPPLTPCIASGRSLGSSSEEATSSLKSKGLPRGPAASARRPRARELDGSPSASLDVCISPLPDPAPPGPTPESEKGCKLTPVAPTPENGDPFARTLGLGLVGGANGRPMYIGAGERESATPGPALPNSIEDGDVTVRIMAVPGAAPDASATSPAPAAPGERPRTLGPPPTPTPPTEAFISHAAGA